MFIVKHLCSGSESKYNVFGSIQHWYKYENRLVTIIFPIHQEASVIYSNMCNLDNTESKVYGGDPRGMRATWNALEDQLRSLHNNTTMYTTSYTRHVHTAVPRVAVRSAYGKKLQL